MNDSVIGCQMCRTFRCGEEGTRTVEYSGGNEYLLARKSRHVLAVASCKEAGCKG